MKLLLKHAPFVGLIALLSFGVMPAHSSAPAANFSNAASSLLQSNDQAALAMYYGLLSLQNDSRRQVYYAYVYMNEAARLSLTAYQNAYAGSLAEYTVSGSSAVSYGYLDWYYKSSAANSLLSSFRRGRRSDSTQAISNGYLALLYSGYAAYYNGLASRGGTY
jgi:hypothetical protein